MLRFGGLHPPRRLFGSANAASREMKLPRLFLEWHEAPHQLQSTSISKIISLYKRSRVFASSHLSLVQHVPIVSRGTNDKPWNRFQPGKENAFVTTYKSWQYICVDLRRSQWRHCPAIKGKRLRRLFHLMKDIRNLWPPSLRDSDLWALEIKMTALTA